MSVSCYDNALQYFGVAQGKRFRPCSQSIFVQHNQKCGNIT